MTLETSKHVSNSRNNNSILYPGESLPTDRSTDKLSPWGQEANATQTPISLGASLPIRFNPNPIEDIMEGLDRDSYNKDEMERIFRALKNFEMKKPKKLMNGTHNKDGLIDQLTVRQIYLMDLIDMVCKPNRIDDEYRSGRDYQSQRLIGEGGFGIVRYCQDNSTQMGFAEKLINRAKYKENELIVHKKLTTDIRLMLQEDSEEITCGVVLMLGAIQQGDVVYLFMEYMEDGSLADMLKNAIGLLSFGYIIWYFHQILEGLSFIHSRRILHLDIKADNILIKNEDYMKIADFGLAKEIPERNDAIYKGFCGTPHFMAPEVIREQLMSTKSDIWSVGCVLYELITRKVPWIGKEVQAIYYTVGTAPKETISKYVIPSPAKLKELGEDYEETYQEEKEIPSMMLDLFDQCFQLDFKNRSTADELLQSEIVRLLFTTPTAYSDENQDSSPEYSVPDTEDSIPDLEVVVEFPSSGTKVDRAITPPSQVTPVQSLNLLSINETNSNSVSFIEFPIFDPDGSIPFIPDRPRSLTQTQTQPQQQQQQQQQGIFLSDSLQSDTIQSRPNSLPFS